MDPTAKTAAFHQLHRSGCFLMPNPWDAGSARFLESLGVAALATTSAGLAFCLGRPDTAEGLPLESALHNVRAIVEATSLPVNADFQSGYGSSPTQVAQSVRACVATGVAGLSIEDAAADADGALYDKAHAVERIQAARQAIDETGSGVLLTARAECFLVGHPQPLQQSVERLVAYAQAGADCLYAPGLRNPADIAEVVAAVAPKPLNVLTADPLNMSVASLAALGVRRISVGSALARVAWRAFMQAARHVVSTGSFVGLADAEPFPALNALFQPSPHIR